MTSRRPAVLEVAVLLLVVPMVRSLAVDEEIELHEDKRIINGGDAVPGSHPYIISLQQNPRLMYTINPELLENYINFRCKYMPDKCTDFRKETIEDYPDKFKHYCGGSLIGESWVLTAAHCVNDYTDKKHYPAVKIVLGEHHLADNSTAEEHTCVEAIIVHPGYNSTTLSDDIALIKLSSPVTPKKHIQFAKLPQNDTEFSNDECLLAGWGRDDTNSSAGSDVLQEVYLDLISFDDCWIEWKMYDVEMIYKQIQRKNASYLAEFGVKMAWDKFRSEYTNEEFFDHMSTKQICVVDRTPGDRGHSDTCQGDSGGPMMCGRDHNILAGVTSWGTSDCIGHIPGVYTRVSAYTCWIKQLTGIGV